jgi:hypothetical protein
MMDSFLIGTYQIGYRYVDVIADPSVCGGSFYYMPDGTERSRMRIGLDYDTFFEVLSVVLHEATEFLLDEFRLRYRATNTFATRASDTFIFHFDHNEFTEVMARLATFLDDCLKDLRAAFDLVWDERKKARGA